MTEPRSWILVACGPALLCGIIAWKLVRTTYEADVAAICDAERRSGFTLRRDMAKVSQWARANLTTPSGNQLLSALRETELAERGERLTREASAVGLGGCPMVESYRRLVIESDFRSDMQHLCSWITFPGFVDLDDDARLAALENWIDTRAKSAQTKQLADPLRRAPAAERAGILRDLARQNELFSCDIGKILDLARPPP